MSHENPTKMFPIQGGPSVPWEVMAPHDYQCRKNHGGQTLEHIAQRGGLCPVEAWLVINGVNGHEARIVDYVEMKKRWFEYAERINLQYSELHEQLAEARKNNADMGRIWGRCSDELRTLKEIEKNSALRHSEEIAAKDAEIERLKLERIGLHATINEWRGSHEKLTARNSELAAEVERLKEKHRNDEQLWTTRYETTYDELAEARKVIERLPKTADGVPAVPSMDVFIRDCEGVKGPHPIESVHPRSFVVGGFHVTTDDKMWVAYSTREAALAQPAKGGDA